MPSPEPMNGEMSKERKKYRMQRKTDQEETYKKMHNALEV